MSIETDKEALTELGNRYSESFLKVGENKELDAGKEFRRWLCNLMTEAYYIGRRSAVESRMWSDDT